MAGEDEPSGTEYPRRSESNGEGELVIVDTGCDIQLESVGEHVMVIRDEGRDSCEAHRKEKGLREGGSREQEREPA